jgi:hypothetical protein
MIQITLRMYNYCVLQDRRHQHHLNITMVTGGSQTWTTVLCWYGVQEIRLTSRITHLISIQLIITSYCSKLKSNMTKRIWEIKQLLVNSFTTGQSLVANIFYTIRIWKLTEFLSQYIIFLFRLQNSIFL